MNNHINIWRVEHNFFVYPEYKMRIGVGPYTYTRHFSGLQSDSRDIRTLSGMLWMNEDRVRRFKNPGYLADKVLPSSFTNKRPGPREDPGLREAFVNKYLSGSLAAQRKSWPIVFVFDSEHQMARWFDDAAERELLTKCGFVVKKYKVPSTEVLVGRSQCVWDVSAYVYDPIQQEFKFN